MNKVDLYKLAPGTILEISWLDNPNTFVILMDKVQSNRSGDIALHCLHENGDHDHHIIHTQVVGAYKRWDWYVGQIIKSRP